MADDHVTRAELAPQIKGLQGDVGEIKTAVALIPDILAQTKQTNSTVAKHERRIDVLDRWRWVLTGGGAAMMFMVGGGGSFYVLLEVIK